MGGSTGIAAWVLLGAAFLWAWVSRVGKFAWEDLWYETLQAVAEAERSFEGQAGLIKRDAVLASIFAYVDGLHLTSGVERWILRAALITLIDMGVKALNAGLGHDWMAAMNAAKHDIETHIPWLADPAPADTPAV